MFIENQISQYNLSLGPHLSPSLILFFELECSKFQSERLLRGPCPLVIFCKGLSLFIGMEGYIYFRRFKKMTTPPIEWRKKWQPLLQDEEKNDDSPLSCDNLRSFIKFQTLIMMEELLHLENLVDLMGKWKKKCVVGWKILSSRIPRPLILHFF